MYGPKDIEALDSVMLYQNDQIYVRSEAALRIAFQLGFPWSVISIVLSVFPAFLTDSAYNWIGRNRYRWWGKTDSCRVPTPEIRSRFML